MKNVVSAIVAMFLLLGVSSNVTAQNPVKKVKFLTHKYEGEVGKKKVPEGEGTMFFEGFTVEGDFQGNEVTNATLSLIDSDIKYIGDLSFDESQEVTLKPGGKIFTLVYYVYGDHPTVNGIQRHTDLVGQPSLVKTIDRETKVGLGFFHFDELTIENIIKLDSFGIPTELNPPSVVKRSYKVTNKITIRYTDEEYRRDSVIIHRGKWDKGNDNSDFIVEVEDGEQWQRYYYDPYLSHSYPYSRYKGRLVSNPKKKDVFIFWGFEPEYIFEHGNREFDDGMGNVFGYVDDKGRTWYCKKWRGSFGDDHCKWIVIYPDGNYIFRSGDEVHGKVSRIDGLSLNGGSNGITFTLYDSNKKIACFQLDCENEGEALDILLNAILKNNRLLKWPKKVELDDGCGTLSDDELEQLIKDKLFPLFTGQPTSDWTEEKGPNKGERYIAFYFQGNLAELLFDKKNYLHYYFEKDMFLSKQQIDAFEDQKKEESNMKRKQKLEKYLSLLNPFIKRFGFNPTHKSMKEIVKVGSSFKFISDYFALEKKYWNICCGRNEEFNNDFRGEDHERVLYGTDIGYYMYDSDYHKFSLSIDHGTRKCYDIIVLNSYTSETLGYVWVSGDKITSVVWY